MGTLLQQSGLSSDECPELWNDTHPELVMKVHKSYKDAGSEVIQTNTFGANRLKLKKYNLEQSIEDLNTKAVKLAKEVMSEDGLVCASIGPTGDMLQPYGSLTPEELYDVFKEQIQIIAQAGADIINIETMMDLAEARIALLAAIENTDLPVICSFTFEKKGRTLMGNPAACLVYTLQSLGAAAVGANCSGGPLELLPIIKEMKKASKVPLIAQPNAGLPQIVDSQPIYTLTPDQMANDMVNIVKAGANIVGGCCGTTPNHIRSISEKIQSISSMSPPLSVPDILCSKYQTVLKDEAVNKLLPMMINETDQVYDLLDKLAETNIADPVPLISFAYSMEPKHIQKYVLDIQVMTKQPLTFVFDDYHKAEAALRYYDGIAGVQILNNSIELKETLVKYGAISL